MQIHSPGPVDPSDDETPSTGASSAAVPAPLTRRELREREERDRLAAQRSRRVRRPERDALDAASQAEPGASAPAPARSRRRAPSAPAVRARRAAAPAPRTRRPRVTTGRVRAEVTAVPVAARVAGLRRRALKSLATYGAMVGVGLILISTTVPANAFTHLQPDPADGSATVASSTTSASQSPSQELTVEGATALPEVTRDGFSVVSRQQLIAAAGANSIMTYTNNPDGTIQWPFPTGAPITSGFGGRHVKGCGFCSTDHKGVDFTPGTGTPIHSIADGVVSKVELSSGGLGNHVTIDHVVNGQKVQSVYAHMLSGSVEVAVGQQVTVGQVVGAVGSTGASTGAHLHLEIHLDGVPVDPFAWLQANAN